MGLPRWWLVVVKIPPANARDVRDTSSVPGLGRSSGEGNSNPLQYSCLENPMDRGAWWAIVHGVSKSQTQLEQNEEVETPWAGELTGSPDLRVSLTRLQSQVSLSWGHLQALLGGDLLPRPLWWLRQDSALHEVLDWCPQLQGPPSVPWTSTSHRTAPNMAAGFPLSNKGKKRQQDRSN